MPFRVAGTISTAQRARMVSAAERSGALAENVRRIANGEGPTHEELALAPLLSGPRYVVRSALCLAGWGEGHPRLPDGSITTTELVVDASSLGWVLTEGRFYRVSEIPIPLSAPCRDA